MVPIQTTNSGTDIGIRVQTALVFKLFCFSEYLVPLHQRQMRINLIKPGRQNRLPKINCQMRVDWLTKSGRLRLRKIHKFPPNADYFNQIRTVEKSTQISFQMRINFN